MAGTNAGVLSQLLRRAVGDPRVRGDADGVLLQRFLRHNDVAAFEALVYRHGPMVLDVCRAALRNEADAEDAFQATFLILARSAGSVRQTAVLGGWLHGVARRTALKARAQYARRRRHEALVPPHEETAPDDPSWGEARGVIHEELSRLSERYREPLVLCYLQGLTQDRAAVVLGLSKGTLKRRLERGRALLRARLVRRGLGPTAALLAAAWPEAASAGLPSALVRTAALVGTATVAGETGAAVPARILALAEGGSRVLSGAALRLVAGAALALGVAGVGLSFYQEAGKPPTEPEVAAPQARLGAEKPAPVDRHGDPLPPRTVARLGAERFRSDGWVNRVAVVPGGKQLLGHGGRAVILWDAATGREVRRFEAPLWRQTRDGGGHGVSIESFAVSPDGKTLAAGTQDGSKLPCPVLLFDLATGRKVGEWQGHGGGEYSANRALAFVSPTLLASAGADRLAHLWDVTAGRAVRALETTEPRVIDALVPSPDGKLLIGTGWEKESGYWAVWDVATGRLVHREAGLPGQFVKAALSPDGRSLAVTVGVGGVQKEGGFNEVRLYSAPDWKEQRRWRTHAGQFPQRNSVAFAPDGKTLATGGADQKVRRWDVATGRAVGPAIEPYYYANNVAYLDADTLLTFDSQQAVKLWDARTGRPKLEFTGSEGHLATVAYAPDGRHVATGGGGGDATVRIWQVATARQVGHLRAGMNDVTCVRFSPDGRLLVSADSGGVARLWDWAAGREVRALGDHKGWLHAVAFSPDGRRLATGDDAGTVRVWDVAAGTLAHGLAGHTAHVTALVFAPDGQTLYSGSWDHTVRRWDLTTGQATWVLKGTQDATGRSKHTGHTNVVTGLALSPGGGWLHSGSYDHTICVWETGSGRLCRILKGPERGYSSVNAIALSPDGTRLAAALGDDGQDSSVHLWDVLAGARVGALPGHRGRVANLAFAPDGRQLASCSVDTTALVWDVSAMTADRPTGDARAIAAVWEDLGSAEPAQNYAAACQAAAAGDATVAAFRARLKPAVAVEEAKVREWVRQLDAEEFAVRERASQALAALGPAAEAHLRKAAAATETAEVRTRVKQVLDGFAAEQGRSTRALEVLEMIGTPAARRLLADVAAGAADAPLTRAAALALKRLGPAK